MNTATLGIVDLGRGPQLTDSRITVQDIVPYWKLRYSEEQILEEMPALRREQLQVLQEYIRTHHEEVMAVDRRIEARNKARQQASDLENIQRRQRLEIAKARLLGSRKENAGD